MSSGLRFSVTQTSSASSMPCVVAPQRVARVDAALAGRANDVIGVAVDSDDELLEARPAREGDRQLEPLARVRGQAHTRLPELAEALRPEPGEVDEPGDRKQRLVRRDVVRRLLAPDVLLACLEGEDEAALAVEVGRLADDSAGHAADVVLLGREEPVVRPAEGEIVARALALADRDGAAVVAGRLQDAERQWVDRGDRQRSRLVRRRRELGSRLQTAEEVRLSEEDTGRVLRGTPELVRIGDAVGVRDLDDVEPEPRRVRFHDLAHLWVQRLGQHDLRPAGDVLRHVARVGGDGRPVVARRVRDVHPCQLADHGLVLEDRLEDALAHLGLVGRVGGQELPA